MLRPTRSLRSRSGNDKFLDHGILDHGILDHGILDHGILDNGILDHGILKIFTFAYLFANFDPILALKILIFSVIPLAI